MEGERSRALSLKLSPPHVSTILDRSGAGNPSIYYAKPYDRLLHLSHDSIDFRLDTKICLVYKRFVRTDIRSVPRAFPFKRLKFSSPHFHNVYCDMMLRSFQRACPVSPRVAMKRIIQLTLLGSILCGCQSAKLASLNPREFLPGMMKKSKQTEDQSSDPTLAGTDNGLEVVSENQVTVADRIRMGQEEIGAWYENPRSSHIRAARQHFEMALKQQPRNNVDAYHGLAVVADLEEDFAEAEKYYQLALALRPSDSRILGNLGYSYLLQERFEESERYLTRAIKSDESNHDAFRNLGDAFLQQGKTGRALVTYTRIMSRQEAEELVNGSQSLEATLSSEQLLARSESAQGQELTDQILRMQAERQRDQMSHQQFESGLGQRIPPQQSPIGRPAQQQSLQSQLAQIDRESYQSSGNQPVVINGSTGDLEQYNTQRSQIQQADYDPRMQGNQFGGEIVTASLDEFPQDSHPRTTNAQRPSSQGGNPAIENDVQQLRQPWNGQSVGQQQTHPIAAFDSQQVGDRRASTQSDQTQDLNAFERAKLKAARLGMGMPTESKTDLKDVHSHSTPRQLPGTNSVWNGNGFSQPERYLPTNQPPQDLTQASELPSVQSQIQSSHGQQLNQSSVTNRPEQFGTAARFQTETSKVVTPQSWNHGSDDSSRLAAERELHNQQMNQEVRQVWDDRPLKAHQSDESIRKLRPAAEYGGMVKSTDNSTHQQALKDNQLHPLLSPSANAPSSPEHSQLRIRPQTQSSGQGQRVKPMSYEVGSVQNRRQPIVSSPAEKEQSSHANRVPAIRSHVSETVPAQRLLPAVKPARHQFGQSSSESSLPLIRPAD